MEELGALADASVASLGLAAPDMFVFFVPARLSALRTLVEMDEHSLSAAGVADDDGELVANLSVSDLRDVPPDKLGLLVCAVAGPGAALAAGGVMQRCLAHSMLTRLARAGAARAAVPGGAGGLPRAAAGRRCVA